jgi:hypothetical protein
MMPYQLFRLHAIKLKDYEFEITWEYMKVPGGITGPPCLQGI